MTYDREITIFEGKSRKAQVWRNVKIKWSEFARRLQNPQEVPVTVEAYKAMSKEEQSGLKDGGGYVGGAFKGVHRKADELLYRDLICIDCDNAPAGAGLPMLNLGIAAGFALQVHTTTSHTYENPRLRYVIPLSRSVTPEEYEPLAREAAKALGVEAFADPTTYQPSRMMFYPRKLKDGQFLQYLSDDKPFLEPGGMLTPKVSAGKQENPREKPGAVGAFCKAYSVPEAIETFLSEVYEPAGHDRYTYRAGQSWGGAVVHDDGDFLYSHHATDPCSGRLANSFDLCRIHMFGHLDKGGKPDTPEHKTKSFEAMTDFAMKDGKVTEELAKAQREKLKEVFKPEVEDTGEDWAKNLEYKKNGGVKASLDNLVIILSCDPALKGKVAVDVFSSMLTVTEELPWSDEVNREWCDNDDSNLAHYLEKEYGITGQGNILKALDIVSGRNSFNSVERYLKNLTWDGKQRIATMLHDYLGAEKSDYTAQVMLRSLTAAIGRAIEGGIKFDYVPILAGAQGLGKSTLLARLGKDWFSDSLQSFDGKDAAELIQGTWINELPELSAFSKSETNKIKQFLSKTADRFRPAYARRTENRPRRCIFFGTTNDSEFLKDTTGNRRYWPVKVGVVQPKLPVWSCFTDETADQIWAEACCYWENGERNFVLTGEAAKRVLQEQSEHEIEDGWRGIVERYLETDVPETWPQLGLEARRAVLDGGVTTAGEKVKMNQVCVAEIWQECFQGDIQKLGRAERIRLNSIMRRMEGWEEVSTMRTSYCGTQRGFKYVCKQTENATDSMFD